MSQKLAGIGDRKRMPNAKIAIDVPILRSMRARPSASAFSPMHFSSLGKPEAVRQALSDVGYDGWASIEDGGLELAEFSRRFDLIIEGK